ncbi:MAG: hypothetical protein ACE15B_19465 [Bryobacteraceae bacterium]
MKWISGWLKRIAGWFRSGAAEREFDRVARLLPAAMAIVERVAQATPNRTDDELAALAKAEGLPLVGSIVAAPGADRGLLLLKIASDLLARLAPGTPTRILNMAVQTAYTGWRAGQ